MSNKPSKYDQALKLAREGLSVQQIREHGIGTSYAKKAYRKARDEKLGEPTQKPESPEKVIQITEEKVETDMGEHLAKLEQEEQEAIAKETEKPEAAAKEIPAEALAHVMSPEKFARVLFDTINDYLPEDRKKPKERIDLLVEAWTPVFEQYLAVMIEKAGALTLALGITLLVFGKDIYDVAAPKVKALFRRGSPNVQ